MQLFDAETVHRFDIWLLAVHDAGGQPDQLWQADAAIRMTCGRVVVGHGLYDLERQSPEAQ